MKNIKYIAVAFLVSGALSAQSININEMPKAGPTPTINVSSPKTFQLKNGLQVLVVENNKLPKVTFSLVMDKTPIYEGKIVGISSVFGSQFGTGTTTLSKEEFNKKLEFYGGYAGFNSEGFRGNTLSKYFPQVFDLVADAVMNPKFSAEEVQKTKERMIESLKTAEKSADDVVEKLSSALVYGKNTALGEFSTEASINNIQLRDVQDFYQKYFTPDNAYLVVVGDVKFDEVKKLVEKNFSKWKKSTTQIPAIPQAKNVATTEINLVDMPSAVQSVIRVGNISTLQTKDPQYFAGAIANYILGGGSVETRLNMNLREKNGFTYGAHSSLSTGKYSPSFEAGASVRNEVTDKAVQEFITEMKGIATISPQELANAKEKLKGGFIMSLEKPETVAQFALNQKIYNLPADFYTNYLKSIDKVTLSDVSNVAKENILPNQARIVIAGKVADIAENLEKLGYPVKYFDKDANQVAKPEAKKIDANISVASIAQKYIDAIGGKANAEKIKSIKTNSVAKVQGMDLEMVATQEKVNGKIMIEMKMMGQTMQKTFFDGKDGYMEAQGQKIPLSEDMKNELVSIRNVFPELDFTKRANIVLKGIEEVNGEEVYVVKSPIKTYYYSIKTGLKTGELSTQKVKDQEISVPIYYSDYKEVNGVKFPFKQSTNMGGMDITFDVKSYEINKATDKDFK